VEAGACGILRRQQASSANLIAAIRSAAGEGTLPPDLLGRLLDQVGRLQRQVLKPRGLTIGGLTEREIGVLKLLADGFDTAEVGERLFLSDRTVKTIVHDVTSRLELRNRTHAVAQAIRLGLIRGLAGRPAPGQGGLDDFGQDPAGCAPAGWRDGADRLPIASIALNIAAGPGAGCPAAGVYQAGW
jgi:DNA-binding CsgD family transcriptional regulator